MTSTQYAWSFGINDTGDIEGNNSPIAQFSGKRQEGLFRESIQNSLDARKEPPGGPVIVSFATTTVLPEDIGAHSLIIAIEDCLGNIPVEEGLNSQFKGGISILSTPPIKALRIRDSNTSGAKDGPVSQGKHSSWKALTKGIGIGDKSRPDSAGSWGFGKFAAFANSPVHTVLYTTAWESEGRGGLHHRHQGKTILVSRQGVDGKEYRPLGYLGNKFDALEDNDVPPHFRLKEQGTAVCIIGYEPNNDWEDTSAILVVNHFFHAILREELEISIGNTKIDSTSIDSIAENCEAKTREFIATSRTDPVATKYIPSIGTVNVRIRVDRNNVGRRAIALVRDAGMMISDNRQQMGLTRLKNLEARLYNFTAIIECLSGGDPSVIRKCESPEHNTISVDYIENSSKKKEASKALYELGDWVRKVIYEKADPGNVYREGKINELTEYLTKPQERGSETDGSDSTGEDWYGEPYQSRTRRRADRVLTPSGSPSSSTGGTHSPVPRRKRSTQPSTPSSTPGSTQQRPGQFGGIRFRPGQKHATHSVRVTFDNPHQRLKDIALIASGDDDFEVAMGIREAWLGTKKLSVHRGKITSLPKDFASADRYTLEIITREPTVGRAFRLKIGGK